MSDTHFETYQQNWQVYVRNDILPGEYALLEEMKPHWPKLRVLDLGIGAGRTTWFFSPICELYEGSDIVPEMVNFCARQFGEKTSRKFAVVDARDLRQYSDASFDLVMFSYNGIDHFNLEDRLKCLKEVRRVLRPEGLFYFCSHSLHVFPYRSVFRATSRRNPIRIWRDWRAFLSEKHFYKRVNPIAMSEAVQNAGRAVLPDRAHRGKFELFYTKPVTQKRELEENGFRLDKVLAADGSPISKLENPTDAGWYYHYFARVVR